MPEYRLTPELERLFSAACDETLTEDEQAALESALAGDTELQDTYLAFCRFHAELRQHAQSSRSIQAALAAAISSEPSPAVENRTVQPAAQPARRPLLRATGDRPVWREHPFLFLGMALVVTFILWTAFLWTVLPSWREGDMADEHGVDGAVAYFSGSDNAVWDETTRLKQFGRGESKYEGPYYAGDRLHLRSGAVRLSYATGAVVVLEGPAEFWVGARRAEGMEQGAQGGNSNLKSEIENLKSINRGFLKLGKLAARCETVGSKGFTIATPHARVTDLGTEFAVAVRDDGAAEVVVLSGEVEVIREASPGVVAERVRLKKDQGAFVAAEGRTIEVQNSSGSQLIAVMQWRMLKFRQLSSTGVTAGAQPAEATPFLDDFNTDTSANYTGSNSYGTGGSFTIDSGDNNVQRITTGGNNTYAVMHNTASLDVGERLSVETPGGSDSTFLMISTSLGQPNGSSTFGFRLRRDNNGGNIRIQRYSNGGHSIVGTLAEPDFSNPLTLWIDRATTTDFDFYYGPDGGRTLIGSASLLAGEVVNPFRVGTQAFGGTVIADFDNLQIHVSEVRRPASKINQTTKGGTIHEK